MLPKPEGLVSASCLSFRSRHLTADISTYASTSSSCSNTPSDGSPCALPASLVMSPLTTAGTGGHLMHPLPQTPYSYLLRRKKLLGPHPRAAVRTTSPLSTPTHSLLFSSPKATSRTNLDQAYRKGVYKACLDTIVDWAVEVPVYQRQNAIIFSTERVDMATVTPDITTFYGWLMEIQNIQLTANE